MAAVKKSVRLVEDTIRNCRALSSGGDINWSGSINSMSARYLLFVKHSLPELSNGEKLALCQCYHGKLLNDDILTEVRMMEWQVDQAYQYDSNVRDIIGHHELDVKSIFDRIKSWTVPQRLAVLHEAQSYWNYNKPI